MASLSQFSTSIRSRSTATNSSNKSNYFKIKLRNLRVKAFFRKILNKFMLKVSRIPYLALESRNYLKMIGQYETGNQTGLKSFCNCLSNFFMREKLLKRQETLDQ